MAVGEGDFEPAYGDARLYRITVGDVFVVSDQAGVRVRLGENR